MPLFIVYESGSLLGCICSMEVDCIVLMDLDKLFRVVLDDEEMVGLYIQTRYKDIYSEFYMK